MDHFWISDSRRLDRINAHGQPPAFTGDRRKLGLARRTPGSFTGTNNQSSRKLCQKMGNYDVRKRPSACRRGARFDENHPQPERGSITLSLILVWLPILAIFGVILCLRVTALRHMLDQRALDRCLHPVIHRRCLILSNLSESNERLRQLIYTIAAIEAAKQAASFIPVAGPITASSAEALQAFLRAAVRSIVGIQNGLITTEKANTAAALKCGPSMNPTSGLDFKRPETLASTLAKTSPALEWQEGSSTSELHVRSWKNLRLESYAHCFPEKRDRDGELNGESYQTSFRHAPAKLRSKPLSSSPRL